ncbi:hypothetical protein EDD85DRAFT_936680 [Armillaria nabsnona]|nr:hypothetical protein EDD85DRAFT_936680 [Armillaria nabsnona]
MSNTDIELPNPMTPALTSQFNVSLCLYAATLGGCLWDIAINLENDYQLLFKHRIRYPTAIYYMSRVFTLGFILINVVVRVTDIPNCSAHQIASGICVVLSQTFTSLLFFLRVTAIWHNNQYVFFFFTFLWFGVIAGAITIPVGIRGAHIGTTQQCINVRVPEYDQVAFIFPLIFDSCTFIAITYRILLYTCINEETARGRLRAFFGRGVPIVSRNLLLGGQQYYLVAVCGNIVCLVLMLVPGLPSVYRAMFTVPVLAIINAMACIVFRKIKLGLITSDGTVLATFHAASNLARTTSLHRSTPLHFLSMNTVTDSPTFDVEGQEAKSAGTRLQTLGSILSRTRKSCTNIELETLKGPIKVVKDASLGTSGVDQLRKAVSLLMNGRWREQRLRVNLPNQTNLDMRLQHTYVIGFLLLTLAVQAIAPNTTYLDFVGPAKRRPAKASPQFGEVSYPPLT